MLRVDETGYLKRPQHLDPGRGARPCRGAYHGPGSGRRIGCAGQRASPGARGGHARHAAAGVTAGPPGEAILIIHLARFMEGRPHVKGRFV